MDARGKCLAASCLGVTGILGLLFLNAAWCRRHMATCQKTGKGLDDTLKESLSALDKATSQVKSVFEHLKGLKL